MPVRSKGSSWTLQQVMVEPEERATELFFQLSSNDRRRILTECQDENLSLTEIAKRLDMTGTEVLRQLHRMTEAGLLARMPDGKYQLTAYAKLVMELASSLDFVSRFNGYFQDHDSSLLPSGYRNRLGELSGAKLSTNTVDTFNAVTDMLTSAKERIYATIEVGFELHLSLMRQRMKDGVKVRWLMQESFLPTAKKILRPDKPFPEIRLTPRLAGHIYLADKSGAVALRLSDGTMSYAAFMGEGDPFLGWAEGLFAHEWAKASSW